MDVNHQYIKSYRKFGKQKVRISNNGQGLLGFNVTFPLDSKMKRRCIQLFIRL